MAETEGFDVGLNGTSLTVIDKLTNQPVTTYYRTIRLARTAFVGVLTITGNTASLSVHKQVSTTRTYSQIVLYNSDETKFINGAAPNTGLDVTLPSVGLAPVVLTRGGMYSQVNSTAFAYTNGANVTNLAAASNSPSSYYAVPGQDLIVGLTPDTFFVQGQCYVSADQGKSWTGPVQQYVQELGATTPSKTSNVPVPLYPLTS